MALTLKDTTGLDEVTVILDNVPHPVMGNSTSIISTLVSGVNTNWELTQKEYLVLLEEIKANISPYTQSFTINTNNGLTFYSAGGEPAIEILFYGQTLSNNWVTGGSI